MRPRRPAVAALMPVLALVLASAACGGGGPASGSRGTSTPPTTTSTATATTTSPPAAPALDGVVVVVDPGHNGANGDHPEVIDAPVDAGGFTKACNTTGAATNDGVTESSVNWSVAQALRDRLVAAGAEVVLTRDGDDGVGPCIDERARTAVDAGADLLVSIHADGAPEGASGFHVIHPALREGYTDDTVGPSAELAADVRDALVAEGFTPAGYVGEGGLDQRDDLGTLNLARVPAVMVEAGNLRHAGDAATLTSADGQSRLATALAAAVTTFTAPA